MGAVEGIALFVVCVIVGFVATGGIGSVWNIHKMRQEQKRFERRVRFIIR